MKIITLATALSLCSISWISVSVSEYQTVEVQPGEDITLQCSNIYITASQTEWFRLVNRTKGSCIAYLDMLKNNFKFCDEFQNEKFEIRFNTSTVFLKIKNVDLSDSGFYFCGFVINGHTVISDVIALSLQGDSESDDEACPKTKNGGTNPVSVILGAVTLFFAIIVIVLAVKVMKRQTAANEEPQPERNENPGSDDLNYAAVSFQPKQKRNRRPASEREKELNVVYAAAR